MKKLLFVFLVVALSSCVISDKLLTSTGGSKPLGVPKQPDVQEVSETNSTSQSPPTAIQLEKSEQEDVVEDATEDSESSFNWYYLILVGVLGIIAFLVYRLKKQSMIKVE